MEQPDRMMPVRHRLRSFARNAGIAAIAVEATLGLLQGLHTQVQAHVAQWAKAQLLSRGISVQTAAFPYNLAALSVHIEGLVAATAADLSHPFLEAARIDVDLPRSILSGRLAVSSLSGDGLRVTLVRRQDGSTNFPHSSGSGSTSAPAPFLINDLSLSNVAGAWRDEVLDMSAEAEHVSLSLRPAAGTSSGVLTLGSPAVLRAGDRTTTIAADARLRVEWLNALTSNHFVSPR